MPLNQQLYHRIKQQFRSVRIANQGEHAVVSGTRVLANNRVGSDIHHAGEYYRVNCPFCGDERHRLWINHGYGKIDPANGKPMTHLVICYNEDCLHDEAHRKQLRDMLLKFRNRNARIIEWGIPAAVSESPTQLHEKPWPGAVVRIIQLETGHPVWLYLANRGFNQSTARNYDLMLCTEADSRFSTANQRIIAPIVMNDVRVGWQARYVGEPRYQDIPKYYTCPGMPKNQLLYNFDRAKDHPFVVIVEGITDVWRFGDPAVAILGKTLSHRQAELLQQTWPNQPIFVALDGEAREESQKVVEQLVAAGRNAVVPVPIPPGCDPADLSTIELWEALHEQARRAGIDLPEDY